MRVWLGLFGAILLAASAGQASYERANALFVAKRFAEAQAAVEEALRLDGKLVPALTLQAKLAMAANRYDLAGRSLERALAVDPRAAYAQFLYGLTAYLSNEMKEALPRFRKARQLAPADPRAALYLGLTTESIGNAEEALALYREAVQLERAAGEVHADTLLPGAKLLLLLGRLDESEKWLREAAMLAPKSRDARFELARLLVRKGEPSAAAEEGEAALMLAGGVVTDSAIHYLLIRAWRESGNPERAAAHAAIMRAQENQAPQR